MAYSRSLQPSKDFRASLANNRASKNLKDIGTQQLHGGLRQRKAHLRDLWVALSNGMDFYKLKHKKSITILKELYQLKSKGSTK